LRRGALVKKVRSPTEERPLMVSIMVTEDQAVVIRGAVEKVRLDEADDDMSVGRTLELICADFLGGR
jgi:hypothetical protein